MEAAEPGPEDASGAVPDPFSDADALEDLGDRIATLAAHIHAATHRMLLLIADFDHRRGWELGGHRSCAHWLQVRTGIDLGTAREKVRTARVLAGLPETRASMARGELSFSQVRALTRVATPENESELLVLARGSTTADLERLCRAWKVADRTDEVELERQRRRSRTFSVFPGDDGMYVVRGRLAPEVGALLMRAVEAASDAIYREKRPPWKGERSRQDAARRRADAVGLIAERALAAGFGGRCAGFAAREEGPTEPGGGREETVETGEPPSASPGRRSVEAGPATDEVEEVEPRDPENARLPDEANATAGSKPAAHGCSCPPAPISGTRAERYQVVIHLEPDTLDGEAEPGRAELEDGIRLSAETCRRLACDASIVLMSHDRDGSILDVGRRTRTISPALRRALDARDRGCRFPGCGSRFTDAHHLVHWAEGGETSLENCVLLCGYHHDLVHEGGWEVRWWGVGHPVFFSPRGDRFFEGGWEPPELGEDPVEELIDRNHLRGISPDPNTAGARWKSERFIPDEVRCRALEVLA